MVEEIAQLGEGAVLLLIREACRSATDETFCKETRRRGADIYALREDLEARGILDLVVEGTEVLNCGGWVKLLEDCEKVFSWT